MVDSTAAPALGADDFGPNGDCVRALLADDAPPRQTYDEQTATGNRFIEAIHDLPGEGSPQERLQALGASLAATADHLVPGLRGRIANTAAGAFTGLAMSAMPTIELHAEAIGLVEAALLWPAVYGRHPNPLGPVLQLAKAGVFCTFTPRRLLLCRPGGLEIPILLEGISVAAEVPEDAPSLG